VFERAQEGIAKALEAMNAATAAAQRNHFQSESKLSDQRANEPSMEEILASIRRIIADDQAAGRPLAAEIERPARSAERFVEPEAIEEQDEDAVFREAVEQATVEASPGPGPALVADPLLSAATGASVAQAFDTLATSMMMQNTDLIEKLARDMLRPMLKAWLDDNLPTIVERLVRAEIERVARGRHS
jgi:cell pole-organizing protein PopZ